jgi:DNA-directed RNA polymerase specialized sigma subunit
LPRGKKHDYVNNKVLLEELEKYRKTGNYSELLGKILFTMAERIGRRREFRYYTYLDDMISESVLTCLKYMHNFNPEKNSNAFAYFSTIIFNAFKLAIKKEQKHSKIKDKALHLRLAEIQREIIGETVSLDDYDRPEGA